jgi:hypothetical protein
MGLSDDARDQTVAFHAHTPRTKLIEPASLPRDVPGLTTASAYIYHWERLLQSYVVRFEADWLRPRGFGSCYLELPPLVGTGTALSGQHLLGNTWDPRREADRICRSRSFYVVHEPSYVQACYDPGLTLQWGSVTVRVDEGTVDAGGSLPAPDTAREGLPTWQCESLEVTTGARDATHYTGRLVPARNGTGAAWERDYLTRRDNASDCSAIATITMANAGLERDIGLLLIGALAGLGATLLVETGVARLAGRQRFTV